MSADIAAQVTIGKVFGGYFNSEESARTFNEVGISQVVPRLSDKISMADFGGGDGFLAEAVRDYLGDQAIVAKASVIDMNPASLTRAQERGLHIVQSDLGSVKIKPRLDLAIARAVLHYNPLERQRRILSQIAANIRPGGNFVHSISSGDPANCALRGMIAALPSLGRVNRKGTMRFVTPAEYLHLAQTAGLVDTEQVGNAPANSWTLTEMFTRFNPDIIEDHEPEQRSHFMSAAMTLIEQSVRETDIQGVELDGENTRITYQYPIFVSHAPTSQSLDGTGSTHQYQFTSN